MHMHMHMCMHMYVHAMHMLHVHAHVTCACTCMRPAALAGGNHRPLQQQRGDAGRVHILAYGTKPAQAAAGRPRRPQRSITGHCGKCACRAEREAAGGPMANHRACVYTWFRKLT